MKKLILVIALFLIYLVGIQADESCPSNPFNLEISNIEIAKGNFSISIDNSVDTYMKKGKKSFMSSTIIVNKKGSQLIVFCNIPEGSYAISIYQDENNNEELDTNFFGIPNEPYGFSNNIEQMTPPSFEQAKVDYKKGDTINVILQ